MVTIAVSTQGSVVARGEFVDVGMAEFAIEAFAEVAMHVAQMYGCGTSIKVRYQVADGVVAEHVMDVRSADSIGAVQNLMRQWLRR